MNQPGQYQIRWRALKGDELEAALSQASNRTKTACWAFEFKTEAGATTQPPITYCR